MYFFREKALLLLIPGTLVRIQNARISALKSMVSDVGTNAPLNYMPPELLPPERNRDAVSTHRLSRMDMQRAMTDVKRFVETRFESDLNLVKVRIFDFDNRTMLILPDF